MPSHQLLSESLSTCKPTAEEWRAPVAYGFHGPLLVAGHMEGTRSIKLPWPTAYGWPYLGMPGRHLYKLLGSGPVFRSVPGQEAFASRGEQRQEYLTKFLIQDFL